MIRNILTTSFAVLKILACALVECLGSLPKKCEEIRTAAEKFEEISKLQHIPLKEHKSDQTSN